MSDVPNITLNDGHTIPQLGYGTYQIEPENATEAVGQALDVGYRHIDTAQMYGNEAEVGAAVQSAGIPREDIYLTSKLNNNNHAPDDARRSFDATLERLDTDYVDLFLIHWPLPKSYDGDFAATWEVMEEFKEDGRARSIGVSNFQPDHLDTLFAETETVPAVNQIEVHPLFCNEAVRAYGAEHDVVTEAWSPIAQAKILDDETVKAVADEVGKTPAQAVLRWHIQRGDVIFPKTVTPSRMEENFALFDFELTPAQMDRLSGLDQGEDGRQGPHPDTFDLIPD